VGNRFASGKHAIAQCDRCDQRFKLNILKTEIIKTKNYNLLVCPACWDPDQPQLQLGMFPEGGSRIFQWGWNPVGGAAFFDAALTPNNLVLAVELGTVTVSVT